MTANGDLSTGQLARAAGVNVETLRYYERIGLLPEPPRRPGSRYRMYPPDAIDTVLFVKRGQSLGFALEEIGQLLELNHGSNNSCADVQQLATAKLAEVDARLRDLSAIRGALSDLLAACRRGDTPACPIIKAISDGGRGHE